MLSSEIYIHLQIVQVHKLMPAMLENSKTDALIPIVCTYEDAVLCQLIVIVVLIRETHFGDFILGEPFYFIVPFFIHIRRNHSPKQLERLVFDIDILLVCIIDCLYKYHSIRFLQTSLSSSYLFSSITFSQKIIKKVTVSDISRSDCSHPCKSPAACLLQ